MSVSGAIRAGAAYVEMLLNDKALVAGLRAAQEKVKAFGASMQAIGKGMMATGGAMAAPLGLSVSTFAGFEKTMARVKGLTQANEVEFAALSKEAKRLGEETEYSASEAAQMMAEFAQRGFKVNQILTASAPALAMATSGNLQLAEAAGIASDIMNGMQLNASKLGDVTDIMAVAFSTSATDLRQLGEAFKYVGPDALAAGISLEEITSAIMILSDAGIKADMAGTTLRGGLQSLINPSNEAKAALARLGVSIKTEDGRFRKFADIVEDMTTGLEKLSEVEAAQAIGEIFTNRQATGFSVLTRRNKETGESGADLLRQKTDSLGPDKRQGAAFRVQKDLLATLWGAWKLIESAVEGVAITIGETLAPTVQEWGAAMLHGIGMLHQVIKDNKEWIPTIAKTAVVLGGIGAALVTAGTAWLALSAAAVPVLGVFKAVGALLSVKVLIPLAAVAAALTFGISAAGELGFTLEAIGPALKAVAGFAVAAGVGIALAIGGAIEVLKAAGAMWGRILKQNFGESLKWVGSAISDIAGKFSRFFDDISATFNVAWGGIVDAIKAGDLKAAGDIAMAGFKLVWKQGELFLLETWRASLKLIVSWWYEAWENIALGMNGIWNGIESALFEGFAAIYRGWGWLMDSMRRQMAGTSSAWSVMAAGFKAGVTFDLDFQKKIENASLDAQKDLKGQLDAIKAAREVEIGKELTTRQGIDQRQKDADKKVKDATATSKAAFDTETGKQLFGPRVEVNVAEAELTTLREQIAEALKMKELATPLAAGFAEAIKAAQQSGVNPKAAFSQAERVAGGGIGAGDTAGTFDAAMLRYMGNTSGDSTAKQQLREQQEQNRLMERLIEIARAAGRTFGS